MRRAVTTYVDDRPHILSDFACLHASVRAVATEDTDLIAFGPASALAQLPPGIHTVRCERRGGKWDGYGFVNSIFFLTIDGADVLDGYDLVLRTDADVHCGPPAVLRRVATLAFEIADDLWSREFHRDPGRWPGWFRGVTSMYANELAVNHLVNDFERDAANLDAASTSGAAPASAAHAHCWHTDQLFSKFAYRAGAYDRLDPGGLDPAQIRFYCLRLALSARRNVALAAGPDRFDGAGY